MESDEVYKITFRKRAAKEYIEAISWYKERSLLAAENFIKVVNEAFAKIEVELDYYRKSDKHFRELKILKYPFTVVYFIDEDEKLIVITTLFHLKRNPKKKFGR